MIDRREVIGGLIAGGVASAARPAIRSGTDTRPDIVFIMADDLGWADVGCYGRDDIPTPNIDRLAREGLRLTDAYAASCVCSPTRVSLITGRWPGRFDVGLDEPWVEREKVGLAAHDAGFVARLASAGYQTSLVGKWHLGLLPEFSPLRHGYQRFFGFKEGALDYFTHRSDTARSGLFEGDRPVEVKGYATSLFGERAVAELKTMAAGAAPFLLSLHFSAPHWPWEAPGDEAVAKTLTRLKHNDGGDMQTYRRMVMAMDEEIGRVLAALDASGRASRTIVVFTSDNGGERFSKMWPLSGRKGELLEGGIRVPAIVRWPRRIAAGSLSAEPVTTLDWAPTLLGAAGLSREAAADRPDGADLAAVFRGDGLQMRRLFWRHRAHGQAAVREGPWKYFSIEKSDYLFHLGRDPMERADLKGKEPGRFAALKAAWTEWNAALLPYPDGAISADLKVSPDRY